MMNARFTVLSAMLCLALAAGPAAARRDDPAPTVVPVGPATTERDPATGLLRVRIDLPDAPPRRILAGVRPDRSPAGRRLAGLVARGAAAGAWGDVYDSRDRGHSRMAPDRLPLATFAVYDPAFVERGLDFGLNDSLVFDAPTFGNSSTALTDGPNWRSLPRLALTRRASAAALATHYAANHVYVFPEHRDHDPERGDLLPANTPYYLISQGSSGSDRKLVAAVALALAALPPDTKAFLRAQGLIAPAVQLLIRRALAPGTTEDAYLSAEAHPTVFAEAPDPMRLIDLAQAMTPRTAPATATLAVVNEAAEGPPAEAFADVAAERLLDTPHAAARIAIGPAPLRRYTLRAEGRGPDGAPARLIWKVLRGEGVRLTPLDPDGRAVLVEAPWQTPRPAPGGVDSTRIDVAVFADAGAGAGPPAFFSVHFPQDRILEIDADGALQAIDHLQVEDGAPYVDPVLYPLRGWRDVFRRAPDGAVLGWTRMTPDGAQEDFDRFGNRVLTRDAAGRPERVERVDWRIGPPRGRGGRRQAVAATTGDVFTHRYAGPEDRIGVLDRP